MCLPSGRTVTTALRRCCLPPPKKQLAQRKHDLVAAKRLEEQHPEWGLWGTEPGHKPGVAVGQRFAGRGPLKALGLHATYFTGIQWAG